MFFLKKIRAYLKKLGPGFITGASDDDPSGIATYSQTGAQFGYNQLWTAPFSFPFMVSVQEMCGRIGMVTGKGLAGVIKKYYSKKVLYFCVLILFLANTINIGANLGAMASSAQLIFGLPFFVWLIIITLVCLLLEIFVSYDNYSRILKYLTFSLFAYIIGAFFIKQDWALVFKSTIIPTFSFSEEYLLNIVAILGTTISPYLFFWQAGEEVEEEVEKHKIRSMGAGIPRVTKIDLKDMRLDTLIGMFFSNLVMFFIILTTGSSLSSIGINDINSATDAAIALRPIAGNFAYLLFAFGVIGTGLLAVPVLAGSSSYAISETFGWKEGLYRKYNKALGFYGVIALGTLIGLFINILPIPPFKLLYYTAVLNGLSAPILLFIIMLIANNKIIMGKNVNGKISNFFGWTITFIMGICGLALIATLF